jgi:hypothetical protein
MIPKNQIRGLPYPDPLGRYPKWVKEKEFICNACGKILDFQPVCNIIICPQCGAETSIGIKEE